MANRVHFNPVDLRDLCGWRAQRVGEHSACAIMCRKVLEGVCDMIVNSCCRVLYSLVLSAALTPPLAALSQPLDLPVGEPMPTRYEIHLKGRGGSRVNASWEFNFPPAPLLGIDAEPTLDSDQTIDYVYQPIKDCRLIPGPWSGTSSIALRVTRQVKQGDADELSFTIPTQEPWMLRCKRGTAGPILAPGDLLPLKWPAVNGSQEIWSKDEGFSVKLNFACALQDPDTRDAIRFAITPPTDQPWPLAGPDHTKTKTALVAIARSIGLTGDWSAGLTIFRFPDSPKPVDIKWLHYDAHFGGGLCFGITSVSITFPAIEMYIASNYDETSCEYKATFAHEQKHYKALVDIARVYQDYIQQRLMQMNVPTVHKLAYVAAADGIETAVNESVKAIIDGELSTMMTQMTEETRAFDAEDTPGVLVQCSNWND